MAGSDLNLDCLEWGDNDNLQIQLDPEGNLECGPNGLRFDGSVVPSLPFTGQSCTPRPPCDCGAITRDLDGNIWAPAAPCFSCEMIANATGNASIPTATDLSPGQTWNLDTPFQYAYTNSSCYMAHVSYDVCYNIVSVNTGNLTSQTVDLVVNNQPRDYGQCYLIDAPPLPGGNVTQLSNCCTVSFDIEPGDSLSTSFSMQVTNSIGNDGNMGLFTWEMCITRNVFAMPDCGQIPLGGNGLGL